MGPYFVSQPNINIQTPDTLKNAYTSNLDPNSIIGKMTNQVGNYLAPMKGFTDSVMTQQDFSAPFDKAFQTQINSDYKPYWDQTVQNPTLTSFANNSAGNNTYGLGTGTGAYKSQLSSLSDAYNTNVGTAQKQWSDYVNQLYNQQVTNYYQSPTAFTTNNANALPQTQSAASVAAPVQQQAAPAQPKPANYTVNGGDSLWSLWNKNYNGKMAWSDFKNQVVSTNGIKDPNIIKPGQQLKLPGR